MISSISSELETEILQKIEERKLAKKDKNFALADKIREDLLEKGIKLIDTREGTTYEICYEAGVANASILSITEPEFGILASIEVAELPRTSF